MIVLAFFLTLLALCQNTSQSSIKACTKPGPFCESCTSLVLCRQEEDGTWSKDKLGTCSKPSKCLEGICTTVAEPICDGTADLKFVCEVTGIFPDPFYCNKYVMCVRHLLPYVTECEDKGYGYNIRTAMCDIKLEGGECEERKYPVPLCQSLGQDGALEENPSIFYTCKEYNAIHKVLYPFLNRCPHGQVYEDYECHDKV